MKKTIKLCALLCVFFMAASYSSNAQCGHSAQWIACHSGDGNQYNDIWQLSCPTGHLSWYMEFDVSGGNTFSNANAAIWGDGPNLSDGIYYDSVQPLNNYKLVSGNLSGLASSLWIEAQATGTGGSAHASVSTW
jgi:hypothetical protein